MTNLLKKTSSKKAISSHISFWESLSTKELVHLLFSSHIQIKYLMQGLMCLVISMAS